MPKSETGELKRTIGVSSLALNVINLTVGAGIFVLPAIVALDLGAAGFVAYIICAALMLLVMLCFADIGSKVTDSGGTYAYVEYAFGPYIGFLINTLFWFGYSIVSDAAIANAMADMIATFYPGLNEKFLRICFFVLVFGFFAWVNIKGVKNGERLVVINTIAKLLPISILVLYGLFHVKSINLKVTSWPAFSSFGEMALVLFFAFVGAETALGNSSEIKKPKKNIPKGILMGLSGILIIYLSIQFISQGILGDSLASYKEAPLAETAKSILGNGGYQMILIGGIISMFGTLSGDVLATSRLIYSGAKKGIYPEIFSRVSEKNKTPVYSIVAFTGLIIIFASLGEFRQLALVSSSAILIIYLAVVLATIKVKIQHKQTDSTSFSLPLGLAIPIAAVIVVLWFLSHISSEELFVMIGFFMISTLVYLFYSRRNKRTIRTITEET